MWPALRAAGIPATLYVDTANLLAGAAVEHVERRYVARYGDHVRDSGTCTYMSSAQLRAAHAEGLDVQLHTHTHSMRRFEPEAVQEEIERNREALALLLGETPGTFHHLAYPSGRCAPALKRVLASAGVRSATTVRRALARPGDDPHFLPRLLDSECDSEIEFEAELAGVLDMFRRMKRGIAGLRRSIVRDRDGTGDAGERRRSARAGPSIRACDRPSRA
jgi:peptidoglycan/xylan/chitin deacetylase (PgdA/CDA1 family)